MAPASNIEPGRRGCTAITKIKIEAISVPDNRRALDERMLSRLSDSLSRTGLLSPLTVSPAGDETGASFTLVSGHHRLVAARRLGWETVPCSILTLDPIQRQIVEIDENLMRAELSPAEHASLTQRRSELIASLSRSDMTVSQTATPSANRQSARRLGHSTGPDPASIRDQAQKTGQSKDRVARSLKRAHTLGDDLKRVKGTSLDSGVELDALAALPAGAREDLIRRAESGEKISARTSIQSDTQTSSPDERRRQARRALSAWGQEYADVVAETAIKAEYRRLIAALRNQKSKARGDAVEASASAAAVSGTAPAQATPGEEV